MRKNILFSFCLLCAGSLSACGSLLGNEDVQSVYEITDEDAQVINATTDPQNRCGVDGISCNDTALIDYTQTAADFKEYGERTPRDQLYTEAATGNNLTATIRPEINEDDIVTEYEPGYGPDEDGLSASGGLDIASDDNSLKPDEMQVGRSNTIYGPGYEIVCTEECDDFANIEEDGIASEFTEDSFDIADYVKNNGDPTVDLTEEDDIEFEEVGDKKVPEEIEVKVVETKITDDTILAWDAQEGDTLRELLTKWSSKAGWKLLWNTNRNYTLSAGVMFKGKFTDVSSALIRAFARARPAPIATFYKGNRVIVVETMENENAY